MSTGRVLAISYNLVVKTTFFPPITIFFARSPLQHE